MHVHMYVCLHASCMCVGILAYMHVMFVTYLVHVKYVE